MLLSRQVAARELAGALPMLQERGLVDAERWASELLFACVSSGSWGGSAGRSVVDPATAGSLVMDDEIDNQPGPEFGGTEWVRFGATDISPVILRAQTLLHCNEYARCAQVIAAAGEHERSALGLFLYAWSTCQHAEHTKASHALEPLHSVVDIEIPPGDDAAPVSTSVNVDSLQTRGAADSTTARFLAAAPQEWSNVYKLLQNAAQHHLDLMDGFNWWLLGMICARSNLRDAAQEYLERALELFPCNWLAWLELATVWSSSPSGYEDARSSSDAGHGRLNSTFDTDFGDHTDETPCMKHWMASFFRARVDLDMERAEAAAELLSGLDREMGGQCPYVVAQLAHCAYKLKEDDIAEAHFERLLRLDPFRVRDLEVYSEILFLKGNRAVLGDLARRLDTTAKYQPEAPLVAAHYYALCDDHRKAIIALRRALRLNPKYVAAWVLLGHEYVEQRNWRAGVAAFRTAVDLAPSDFRAWYNLAHAFELVKQYTDALWCYKRAAVLRPLDSRVWSALGDCYVNQAPENGAYRKDEERVRRQNAVNAFKRAEQLSDVPDFRSLAMLAQLSQTERDFAAEKSDLEGRESADNEAAFWHKRLLDQADAESVELQCTVDALEFLGEHLRSQGSLADLDEAESCCVRLLDFADCRAKDRAHDLLREISAIRSVPVQTSI